MNKADLHKYLKSLESEMKAGMYHYELLKEASEMSEECFEDVWCDFDTKDSGYISWHSVKPFIQKAIVCE